MAGAQSMAARPIKTLAALLVSRRPHFINLACFSTDVFNAGFDATAGGSNVGDDRLANLSRESVIYRLKKLDKDPAKALDLFRWVDSRSPAQLGETAYALMLRILARKDCVEEFWILVDEMLEKGIEMDKDLFLALATSLAKEKLAGDAKALQELFSRLTKARELDSAFIAAAEVIMGSEWDGEVEKKLDEIACSMTDKMCLRMLMELKSEPVKAMAFFRWAADRGSDYKHNTTAYNAMVKILGNNGLAGEFWDFVKEMKTEGFDIDYDTYVKLFRHFNKKKMMKDAVELYEMMMVGPYKPAPHDCGEIFRQFTVGDDVDFELVSRAVKVHEACGYSMTKLIYNGIHCAVTGMGRFEEGEKIVQTMREAGFEPDIFTYNQLVFGLCKFEKLEDAGKVLKYMEKLGCPPDVNTWIIMIKGYCSVGEVDQALACFAKTIDKKLRTSPNLLQILVQALLDKNKVDGAYTIVTKLAYAAMFRPWKATYKLVIERLLDARKVKEAVIVLKWMKNHDYPIYTDSFVDNITKFGTGQDAVNYFKALKGKDYPAAKSYQHVFEAFFKEGKHHEAQGFLHKCPLHIRNHPEVLKVFAAAKAKKHTAQKKKKPHK